MLSESVLRCTCSNDVGLNHTERRTKMSAKKLILLDYRGLPRKLKLKAVIKTCVFGRIAIVNTHVFPLIYQQGFIQWIVVTYLRL
jgi:hypothetical protein